MADPSGGGISGTISHCTYHTGFNEIIIIVLLTLLFIAGITYMLAQFMRRPEWTAWVKIQLYHIGVSALLAAGAVWFAGIACTVSLWLAGGDPFTIADEHISNLFTNNIRKAIFSLVKIQVASEYLAGLYIQIGSPTFGTGFSAFPVYRVISSNAQFLITMMIPFASSLLAQKIGLELIHATAFTILLPMGILLRAFAITRDAGSFLIATSIGLFVVFPLTYVMNKMIMEGPTPGDPGYRAPATPPTAAQPTMCVEASEGYDRASDQGWWQEDAIYPNSVLTFLTNAIPFRPDKIIAPAMQCMAYVMPQALFLPALNMIITIAFINSLTKFLSRHLGG
ncbi:hypothetical protein DRN67_01000 [Candidatus Micrarchaeota archaeon]|nr:MAG: hypothetical protein DRN67_01000 [Candidatus Micrarchaeota archaeon]